MKHSLAAPVFTARVGAVFGVFAAIAIVHLIAQILDNRALADVTQVLLMPLLAVALLLGTRNSGDHRLATVTSRRRLVWIVGLALFFSWLGDLLPRFLSGDEGFLTMVGCFMLAQIAYIVAFAPFWRRSVLRQPLLALPYLVALALLVAACAQGAGALFVPVVSYGIALTLMAMLATGLGRVAAFGGGIFFASDALIALRSFADMAPPLSGFWIMLTYSVGQALIVVAVIRAASSKSELDGR